jgi:hypothetical protein
LYDPLHVVDATDPETQQVVDRGAWSVTKSSAALTVEA